MFQLIVEFLKTDPRARYQGHLFYFREGFCWTNILNPQAKLLKTKLKQKTVNDVGSMSLSSIVDNIPNYYLVALLNSELLFNYYREYINNTVNIQINDIRQLPIVIPNQEELSEIKNLFKKLIALKKEENETEKNLEYEIKTIEQFVDKIIDNSYYSI
ncbi:MAG: BREX-1 system adenine-specific DNA-methyltransferase PglX [Bacteroidales bacterium]|nr:BREX-1 system adenine-specific DNA-methyltransferase PglX [Bacteroidales bacterium]MDD3700728.1 DNA modification methylase [Bacteroidales bacterium]MDY0369380.1 DNA modification methylase [Bacteroidales bacterium]